MKFVSIGSVVLFIVIVAFIIEFTILFTIHCDYPIFIINTNTLCNHRTIVDKFSKLVSCIIPIYSRIIIGINYMLVRVHYNSMYHQYLASVINCKAMSMSEIFLAENSEADKTFHVGRLNRVDCES